MIIYEFLWSLYIHNIRDENYVKAGLFCSFIMLTSGITTILFIDNHWLLIPAAIGAFIGTWISKFFYKKNS